MKKMLVIEGPESCETCPLRSYSNLMLVCTPMREAASDVECPLRPLPTDMIGAYANSFAEDYISFTEGWDFYEKALIGETE